MSYEPDIPLELSDEQRALGEAVSALGGVLLRHVASGPYSMESGSFRTLFSVSAAAAASTLPTCPHAPPGKPLNADFDGSNNLIYRCGHASPQHCWNWIGHSISCP